MARVFIGIGSNLNPEENVRRALMLLGEGVCIVGISTFYLTEAEGRPEQPPFYNGIVEVETDFPPSELKHSVLRRIEEKLGRKRSEDKYAPRTIDLDVIIYDNVMINTDDFVIPDPEIGIRPFLAIPLCELAPDLTLPGSGLRIREVAAAHANHKMEPLVEFTELLRREIANGP
jgi:dihydroneopterin aldolase/2-amino-4-hydroxy-6-hydroxymethyldihydropteridine diphosphokinase